MVQRLVHPANFSKHNVEFTHLVQKQQKSEIFHLKNIFSFQISDGFSATSMLLLQVEECKILKKNACGVLRVVFPREDDEYGGGDSAAPANPSIRIFS